MKKIIAVFLVALTVFSVVPFSAFAAGTESYKTETQETDYSSDNVLGGIIANAMNDSETEKEFNNNCFIQSVALFRYEAEVELSAQDNSTVVVAVYDEESKKMVTSGKTSVDSLSEVVSVTLAECEMPEYFVIKAFLLDEENKPLCENYENRENTKAFAEFFAKTIYDFDEEKVINLDASDESNFAVIADDATISQQTETENILVTNNYDEGIYVFENADEVISHLSENDVLYFVYGDAQDDYIITKVGSVKNDNGTVTVTAADEFEISDFFSYIKIDSTKQQAASPQTFALARGFDDENGDEDVTKQYSIEAFSVQFKNGDKKDPDKEIIVDSDIDYDITVNCYSSFLKNYVKFYYDIRLLGKDAYEFEYKITASFNFSLEIDAYGEISIIFYGLKDKAIPILPALDITVTIKLKISFSVHAAATGTIGVEMTRGIQRSYDKRKNIDVTKKIEPETKPYIRYTGSISLELAVEPAIEAGFRILKVFSAKIGVEGKIAYVLTLLAQSIGSDDTPEYKIHCCDVCFDVKKDVGLSVYFKIGFNITKDPEKEQIIAKLNLYEKTTTPKQSHLSSCDGDWEFEDGECDNYLYRIEFYVTDELKQPYAGIEISEKSDSAITDSNGIAVIYMKQGAHKVSASEPNGRELVTEEFVVKKESCRIDIEIFRCKVVAFVRDDFGNPLPDVTVYNEYVTNEDGQVEFYLTSGMHTIRAVTKEGFEASKTIIIADNPLENVELVISECKVYIRVIDNDGKPIQGALINDKYTTDANGETEAYLEKGENTVSIRTPDGATVLKDATVEKIGQEFEFIISKCKVIVTVTDENNNPLFDICVNNKYFTNINGTAEFEVAEGIHSVFVNAENGEEQSQTIVVADQKQMNVSFVIDSGKTQEIAQGQCGDDAYWKLRENGELYIYGTGDMWDFEYNITSYSQSCKAPWYPQNIYDIKTVKIEEGITSIGTAAFLDISHLESVIIPKTVTSIGDFAFYCCRELRSVNIPDSVKQIEIFAFAECIYLNEIAMPEQSLFIGNSAFESSGYFLNSENWDNGVLYIGKHFISAKNEITECAIKDETLSIASRAFYMCENLANVTIPDSVEIIGDGAFDSCKLLDGIIIPEKVTMIGNSAFSGCSSLTEISIPDGVSTLKDSIFRGCSSLAYVSIPDSVTAIGDRAFSECISLKKIIIPESVERIGTKAFEWCDSLSDITLPSSSVYFCSEVFTTCEYYENEDNWNDGVLYIGNHLCGVAENAEKINIKQGTVSIAGSAFRDCKKIEEVNIPYGVGVIGDQAFIRCSSLKTVNIPDSVKIIGGGTFSDCKKLESVTLPSQITSIGNSLFYGCNRLADITIPENVTTIGDSAFYDCYFLKEISIPKNVLTIGNSAFYGCGAIDNIVIPDGVRKISDKTFYNCGNLTNITIPDSVASIGISAFDNCYNLETVYYTGTQEQWERVDIIQETTRYYLTNVVCLGQQKSVASNTVQYTSEKVVTETVNNAVVGNDYIILVIKDENAEDLLAFENLLFIDQKKAESEELSFSFNLDENITEYSVIFCNAYLGQNEETHSHEYTTAVTAPSCAEKGFTTYTCVCGDSYIDDYVDAAGHYCDTWEIIIPAQVGIEGLEQLKCDICNEVVEEKIIPAIEEEKTSVFGDVNGDGEITASDARMVLRFSAELDTPTSEQIRISDVNNDGEITASDARKILRISAELE